MITFTPTRDAELIRQVLTHKGVWEAIADDFSGPPSEFEPILDLATIAYVRVDDDGVLAGIFTFAYKNRICWEVHCSLLPHAWGRAARRIARALAEWIWTATACQRVTAEIAVSNWPAIAFAKWAGFTPYGRNEASVMRGGKLEDRLLVGISRPR